jgi:hypothetical protein
MIFYFDDETGVMRIAFQQEAGPCVYIESAVGVFRIEQETHRIVSVAIPFFYEKLAEGSLSLPDVYSASLPPEIASRLRVPR